MNHLIRTTGSEVERVDNRTPVDRYIVPVAHNQRVPVERAFPLNSTARLYAEARPVTRPETVVVVRRVMDSQLKHVLWVFATFLLVAFVIGLILWGLS